MLPLETLTSLTTFKTTCEYTMKLGGKEISQFQT